MIRSASALLQSGMWHPTTLLSSNSLANPIRDRISKKSCCCSLLHADRILYYPHAWTHQCSNCSHKFARSHHRQLVARAEAKQENVQCAAVTTHTACSSCPIIVYSKPLGHWKHISNSVWKGFSSQKGSNSNF